MIRYCYIDWYRWFKYNEIIEANTVHHVEEVKENWDRRLDINNLIPLSAKSHKEVHDLYVKDKKGTQEYLFKIIEKVNEIMYV